MKKDSYYGINEFENSLNINEEELMRLGFTVIDSGLSDEALTSLRKEILSLRKEYLERHDHSFMKSIGEHNGIRMPLSMSKSFLDLAFNENLITFVDKVLKGNYILNQQNAVINPANENYNQAAWHRDLPYQHVIFSRPMAINALFCIDDFTTENGGTVVIPNSHKFENYPSEEFVERYSLQVEAKAGSFIILDCMSYHRGGYNSTDDARCAINHVFTSPIIPQQINMKNEISDKFDLSEKQKRILSFNSRSNSTISDYLNSRA
ncbi:MULTISPECIES: phytanoyl-CoA dioxygenase family protein [Vibrio]|jgi:hypothetical protein|uniref:phytanoyl-CoA dioxygenase family protein n=1 Tax=Vibrio TaxID=662 RepID=UPI000634DED3|nr:MULTISPECIES: phytanoyl-CoA dioxygenase family protein [Vibrio]MCQ8869333.1 phytanoyl-CoA dioxygenase family protein [Vibrio splendidus]MDH5896548.1 phytanoyl-CoA dioxygenase family protein [Vibrio splendidus]MDH5918966.1 phytanoyl-CoA dioxygenase family protein [Vibrio splendidus]MDH6028036.1 phytanoyl-CoA dioxygenase family protein [Vibrio splendidus]PMG54294.1 hypothetical protein BCU88_20140 [Vibrio splendidus]